jgi:hypothetical protein
VKSIESILWPADLATSVAVVGGGDPAGGGDPVAGDVDAVAGEPGEPDDAAPEPHAARPTAAQTTAATAGDRRIGGVDLTGDLYAVEV